MKASRLIVVCLTLAGLIITMISCEYDVQKPRWEKDFVNPGTPVITRLEPDRVASPGFNTIKILGENFAETQDDNKVYFNNISAEIIAVSQNSIEVRRPNLVSDSCLVKVVSYDALVVAKYSPYKIEPVMARYGDLFENLQLSTIAVDKAENLYTIQNNPRTIFKYTPTREKTIIAEVADRLATDAKFSPDGKLLLLKNYRRIYALDLATVTETEWMDARKAVSFGDFDNNGIFYVGGRKSDLIVINRTDSTATATGVWARDEILDVCAYDGYIYLLVDVATADAATPDKAIWRHQILDEKGNLGSRELVLNWAETGEYAQSIPNSLAFSADGIMYIGTDHTHPIMMLYPDGRQDILYKGILPASAEKLVWGSKNYLYMMIGGDEWNVIQIDMGAPGAP